MVIMLLIAVVPLAIATGISYQNSKLAIEKEILGQNSTKIEWVNNEIKDNLDRIDEGLTAFYYDNDVQFYLGKVGEEDILRNTGSAYFRDRLKSYLFANYRDFESVSFYVVEERKAYHISSEEGSSTELLSDNFMEENAVFALINSLFIYKKSVIEGPYLTKYYRRFDDKKIMGVLVTKIKWDFFDKAVELLNKEEGSEVYYINRNGLSFEGFQRETSSKGDPISLLSSIEDFEGAENYFLLDDNYVFFEQMTDDIYMVKTIPKRIVSESYIKTLNLQMVIIIVTGLLVMIITIYIGMRVTKPITMLAKSMQDIEGHINGNSRYTLAEVKSNDEIKILEQSYKMMLMKIKELIDQEYKQKIELQSAHLMALQAQINPHFMYNTLQMIGAMAVAKDSPEIYQIITAFSKMMRYNMRLTEEMVTIHEELINVTNYLEIQQMRFNNQLSIDYSIQEQTRGYKIPKLSLQPIVENCFKHGFLNNKRAWHIQIIVEEKSETIEITILDNGKGISDERVREIHKDLAMNSTTISNHLENLGLKNIDTRIKLYFGAQYGLLIEGNEVQGTNVKMRIGKILFKEGNSDD